MKTLKEMLIEAGYPKEEMDHHYSDLYVYVTPLTTKVIEEWCNKKLSRHVERLRKERNELRCLVEKYNTVEVK